jgi:hypothetical protein
VGSPVESATSQASMEQHHDERRVDPARGIDHKPTPPAGLPDPLRGNPNLTLTSPQLRRPELGWSGRAAGACPAEIGVSRLRHTRSVAPMGPQTLSAGDRYCDAA